MKIPASPIRSLVRRRALPKLFLLISAFFVSYLLFAASPTRAFEVPEQSVYESSVGTEQSANPLNTKPDVPHNLSTFTQVLLLESLSALSCQLGGYDPARPNQKCLGVDPKTGEIGFVENGGGAIGVMGKLIDVTLTPPISSRQYVAYLQNNFGVAKNTYAQAPGTENPCARTANAPRGVGFCALEPVLDLWVAMRNIVYLILILAFVIIGLGIMLRVHVDPRTVMTVQNQIPKIIAGIVVITFSFAIAGLLVDAMWVATYLFASVISSATETPSADMLKVVQAVNPFEAAHNSYPGGVVDIASGTANAFSDLVTNTIKSFNLGFIEDVIGGVLDVLAFIIIFIAIIVALIRLWVVLIITYINVILDVVFAPFWIIAGILPGSSLGIGGWFRDLIANLAVFPVAIGFFLLGSYFVQAFGEDDTIINRLSPPLLGGTDSTAVAALIGLGFILMLPNLLGTVKAALKAPKINFGPILGPIGVGGRLGGKLGTGLVDEYARKGEREGKPSLLQRSLLISGIAKRYR